MFAPLISKPRQAAAAKAPAAARAALRGPDSPRMQDLLQRRWAGGALAPSGDCAAIGLVAQGMTADSRRAGPNQSGAPPAQAPAQAPAAQAPAAQAPVAQAPAAQAPVAQAPAAQAPVAQAPAPPAPCIMTSRTFAQAPDGSADTRRTVGASEIVEFRIGPAADWSATAGWPAACPGLTHFFWTAPETPGSATITAVVPGTGETCTATMTVQLPTSLSMVKGAKDTFPAGQQGVGMTLTLTFLPRSVSFRNCAWFEVPGPATNVYDYFETKQKAGVDLSHHPNPNWVPINVDNQTQDHAAIWGWPTPWSPGGGYTWVIPNRVRSTLGSGPGTFLTDTTQIFTMLPDGTTSVSKGGQIESRHP